MAEEGKITERLKKELEKLAKEGLERVNKLLEASGKLWDKYVKGVKGAGTAAGEATPKVEKLGKAGAVVADILGTIFFLAVEKLARGMASLLSPNVEALTLGFGKNEESVRRLNNEVTRLALSFEQGQQKVIRPLRDALASLLLTVSSSARPFSEMAGAITQTGSAIFEVVAIAAKAGTVLIGLAGAYSALKVVLPIVAAGLGLATAAVGPLSAALLLAKAAAVAVVGALTTLAVPIAVIAAAATAGYLAWRKFAGGVDESGETFEQEIARMKQMGDAAVKLAEDLELLEKRLTLQKDRASGEVGVRNALARGDAGEANAIQERLTLRQQELEQAQETVQTERQLRELGAQVSEELKNTIRERLKEKQEAEKMLRIHQLQLDAETNRRRVLERNVEILRMAAEIEQRTTQAVEEGQRSRLSAISEELALAETRDASTEKILDLQRQAVAEMDRQHQIQVQMAAQQQQAAAGRLALLEQEHARRAQTIHQESDEAQENHRLRGEEIRLAQTDLALGQQRLANLQRESPLRQHFLDLERQRVSLLEKERQLRLEATRAEETLSRARGNFDPERAFQRARSRFVVSQAGLSPGDREAAQGFLQDMFRLAQESGDDRLMQIAASANLRSARSNLSRTTSDRNRVEALQDSVKGKIEASAAAAETLRGKIATWPAAIETATNKLRAHREEWERLGRAVEGAPGFLPVGGQGSGLSSGPNGLQLTPPINSNPAMNGEFRPDSIMDWSLSSGPGAQGSFDVTPREQWQPWDLGT
jgi:hypothetical protein